MITRLFNLFAIIRHKEFVRKPILASQNDLSPHQGAVHVQQTDGGLGTRNGLDAVGLLGLKFRHEGKTPLCI